MKKGRKILACLILMVLVLSQVPRNLLVRAEEGEETKYNLSFELERDASALNEIYQKHDEGESESEKTDEKASDKEANGEEDANKDVNSKANQVNDNDTVVDLSQVTEGEENSSEEAKPVDEAKPIDEVNDEAESSEEENEEAVVLPSGGGEGSQEEKAEEVKDLNITYTLHIKGESEESIEKRIIYSVEKADFVGDLKFEGIETLSNELEVKYYSREDGSSFDEKSENFDLYLETNVEKTVLELPRIGEKEDSLRVKESNFEEAIEISEEKVGEVVGDPNSKHYLSFNISRYEMTDYDYIISTYTNYWMSRDDQNVFDSDEWRLNNFTVINELHVDGVDETIKEKMIFNSDEHSWSEKIEFRNIEIPYEDIEIQYYKKADSSLVKPYLLHYDFYLKKSEDGKMVLQVPRLAPKNNYSGDANQVKIFKVSNVSLKDKDGNAKEVTPTEIDDINLDIIEDLSGIKPSDTVYVNGKSGDDQNDGLSKENAVKTFAKAKEIAQSNKDIVEIVVTGQTDIEGDISLEDTNAKICRSKDYYKYLFNVPSGKTATLSNIIIDGKSNSNESIKESLIRVNSGATLNINEGAVLRNNKIMDIKDTATRGGAVNAFEATINMTGGSVEENQASYGGGIYLYKSTMNFSGGVVQNNEAKRVIDYAYGGAIYSAGGGIIASGASTINFSGDAKVLNNSADEVGGGISLGTRQVDKQNKLYMTGGLIDGNTAGASGGGIFIQCRLLDGGKSIAYISSGRITNNKMDGTGLTEMAFGGGGIYVNGFPASWDYAGTHYYGENGDLYLTNAIIRNNNSDKEGAGFAGCPISKTQFYVNNGVAIYGNNTRAGRNNDKGKTVYLLSSKFYMSHSGQAEYKLDKRMLGGAPYDWKKVIGSEIIPLPDNELEATLPDNSELALNSNDKCNNLTEALGKVIIEGNYSATRGAGIGSNGTIKFGTEAPTTEVSVEKKWNDNDDEKKVRPVSITVNLIANYDGKEYKVDSVILNKDNNWKHTFKDLPTINDGNKITYTVKEETVTGYSSKITGSEKDGFTIINTPEEPKKETKEIKVSKVWDTSDKKAFAKEITVELYKNNEKTDKTLTLNEDNNWQGTFENLDAKDENDKEITYTVKEVGEKDNKITFDGKEFKVSYKATTDGYTITNSYNPPEEPKKEYRDICVEKAWDIRGMKPISHIEVELYRDGEATGNTLVLSEANSWSGSFKNLEKASDGGHIYDYSVKEIGEKFYTVEISGEYYEVIYRGHMDSGFTIINKEEPPKKPQRRDIRVRKVWDVTNKIPVDEIQVELYKDGRATGNVITLSEANGWTGRFEDLLGYDAEGVKYEYSVREVGEASSRVSISGSDYDVSYEGDMNHSFVIINKENSPLKKKIDFGVNKVWRSDGKTEAVQVELYMDGAATGKIITLSEANGWSGAFTDLDLEDAKGNKHIYTVKEIGEVSGGYYIGERKFSVIYEGSMNSGITIINSEEPPKEEEEEPSKDKDDEPKEKDKEHEKHIIPKTGVEEGSLSIVLALVVLVGLFFVKRKLNEGKTK